jgi:hypothetical protein
VLFSDRPAGCARKDVRAASALAGNLSLTFERPLQHSTPPRPPACYSRRLATFAILLTVGGALACYQDKPAPVAKNAQQSAASPSSSGSAQLDLQPVPATHDTAIREIDQFRLTQQGFQAWIRAKKAIDALHTTNPEIEERMKAATPPKTVDEAGKRFDGEPKMRDALKASGLSGKDFLLTSIALQQAMKGYQLKALGKLDQSKVPPAIMANISFVAANMPAIMGSMTGVVPRRPTP